MIISRLTLPEDQIQNLIAQYSHHPGNGQKHSNYRKASVLIPLLHEEEWKLLFIRRTETVLDHKGQVAFPGGAYEPQDDSPASTALREAYEEIGLQSHDVKVLGQMDEMSTVTGYDITPVVGIIPWPYPMELQKEEVSHTFSIPLRWLADENNYEIREMRLKDASLHKVYYYKDFKGETLWGITAKFTVDLLIALHMIKTTAALL
jgi:8-oxo-dGTP pyrophosphatase MutT (NUDIX family)